MNNVEKTVINAALKELDEATLQVLKINTLLKCADDAAVALSDGLEAENIQTLILVLMDEEAILSKEIEKAHGHVQICETYIRKTEGKDVADRLEAFLSVKNG
jgi:hypothetical protein